MPRGHPRPHHAESPGCAASQNRVSPGRMVPGSVRAASHAFGSMAGSSPSVQIPHANRSHLPGSWSAAPCAAPARVWVPAGSPACLSEVFGIVGVGQRPLVHHESAIGVAHMPALPARWVALGPLPSLPQPRRTAGRRRSRSSPSAHPGRRRPIGQHAVGVRVPVPVQLHPPRPGWESRRPRCRSRPP